MKRRSDIERFMAKVDKQPSGCWLWTANIDRHGYGTFAYPTYPRKRKSLAHRFAYEHFKGPIPAGLQIDHLCRVRHCVNPNHMEAVTCRTNLMRSHLTWAARNASKSTCPRGHPLDGRNSSTGTRYCRTCAKARLKLRDRRRWAENLNDYRLKKAARKRLARARKKAESLGPPSTMQTLER